MGQSPHLGATFWGGRRVDGLRAVFLLVACCYQEGAGPARWTMTATWRECGALRQPAAGPPHRPKHDAPVMKVFICFTADTTDPSVAVRVYPGGRQRTRGIGGRSVC